MWSDKLIQLGIFQRISFMIKPGVSETYGGLTRYPAERQVMPFNNLTTQMISANRN